MRSPIAFLLILFTVSADRVDAATCHDGSCPGSRTGSVLLQQARGDLEDMEQNSEAGKCPKWCKKSAKKKGWPEVCSWKNSQGQAKCGACSKCGGGSGGGGDGGGDGGGGGTCRPGTCVGCGGQGATCTLTACKESESCCNHFKDLQNRINDVKQNWRSRGSSCRQQLDALFQETEDKMQSIGRCSSMSLRSPCMKCFACRSRELNFCNSYKNSLGCGAFSLISVNASLQDSDEQDPDELAPTALVSRAAIREGDHIGTTETVFRSKNCY